MFSMLSCYSSEKELQEIQDMFNSFNHSFERTILNNQIKIQQQPYLSDDFIRQYIKILKKYIFMRITTTSNFALFQQ